MKSWVMMVARRLKWLWGKRLGTNELRDVAKERELLLSIGSEVVSKTAEIVREADAIRLVKKGGLEESELRRLRVLRAQMKLCSGRLARVARLADKLPA